MAVEGVGAKVSSKIYEWKKFVELNEELRRIDKFHCTILTLTDENYLSLIR